MKKCAYIIPLRLLWSSGCPGEQPDSSSKLLIGNITLIDGAGADPQIGVRIADSCIVLREFACNPPNE